MEALGHLTTPLSLPQSALPRGSEHVEPFLGPLAAAQGICTLQSSTLLLQLPPRSGTP